MSNTESMTPAKRLRALVASSDCGVRGHMLAHETRRAGRKLHGNVSKLSNNPSSIMVRLRARWFDAYQQGQLRKDGLALPGF